MDILITVVVTVLMFGVLILIHEFGHFITAKLFNVKVNEFSLGMGPRLLKFGKGETEYSLRALPIGGYVSMEGEDSDSEDARAFNKQKVYKRIIICLAGVFMNFVLGFLIAVLLVAFSSSPYLTGTIVSKTVSNDEYSGKISVGDEILSISGYKINVGEDITFGVSRSDPTGKTELIELKTDFVVRRNGEIITVKDVSPFVRIADDDGVEQDVYSFYVVPEKKDLFNVIKHGFFEALSYVRTTYLGLSDLITGRVGIDSLGSVVKIGEVVGESVKLGASSFFYIAALISVNLGVMNLLPIPALDGGRVVLLAFEGIFRKKLNSKIEYALIAGSMILLYILVAVITVKDIASFF